MTLEQAALKIGMAPDELLDVTKKNIEKWNEINSQIKE